MVGLHGEVGVLPIGERVDGHVEGLGGRRNEAELLLRTGELGTMLGGGEGGGGSFDGVLGTLAAGGREQECQCGG